MTEVLMWHSKKPRRSQLRGFSMSRFCKFGKLHVTKGNVDKLLGIRWYVKGCMRSRGYY